MLLRHAVVGLGFMGRTHIEAIQACQRRGMPCELAAVCDGDRRRLEGDPGVGGNMHAAGASRLFDPAHVRGFTDCAALFADDGIDVVHLCTWTDTHVDLAVKALAAGKHVIVEKPVATRSDEVQRLADAAARCATLCMPAMCMRFWPGWTWLKERIADRSFGAVRSATFRRLGSPPAWNDFYRDESRSGGALFDLHVHDTDFVFWCFGMPTSVQASGSSQHVTTLYRFADGPTHVAAEGGWTLDPGAGFRMTFLVDFERATAEFDLARTPTVTLYVDGRSDAVVLPEPSGYEAEVAAAVHAISIGDRGGVPTIDEAVVVTRIIEAERRALAGTTERP